MLFERIEDKGLSQFSYIVGCDSLGAIAVIDPRRDVDVYLDFARARDLRITHVLETHIHADFASGALELAAASGAELAVSAYDRGEQYETTFPHRALSHDDIIEIGRVRLQALHTPGHTPEHLSFLVFDTARSATHPLVLLSGDFLFVGSLGRPDLLGDEATRALAGKLYRSVRDVLGRLPDGLEIAPGHGAGSLCGAGMSGRPTSTLGFERIANPYLRAGLTEAAFIEQILANVPPFPPYYRRMKALNAAGAPALGELLGELPGLHPLTVAAFDEARQAGAVVIDLRDQVSFGVGHVPGSLGIGAGANLSTWAAWVAPYDTPLLLVAARADDVDEAIRALVRVGLDDVRGYLADGVVSWIGSGHPVATLARIAPAELAARLADADGTTGGARLHDAPPVIIDVRSAEEWNDGHVASARLVPADEIAERLADVPPDQPVALFCGTGYRSTVAASVLARAGRTNLSSVTGGMTAWKAANLPIVQDSPVVQNSPIVQDSAPVQD